MILRDAKERQVKENKDNDDSDDAPGAGGNSGTMIVDATCAPSHIRYSQDVSLLNEARENAEKFLDTLQILLTVRNPVPTASVPGRII